MLQSITRYSTLSVCALLLNIISCRKHDDDDADAGTVPVTESGAETTEDTGDDVEQSSNQGRMHFEFGLGADPDERSCDLWWSTNWRLSSLDCPDCIWTADVDFMLDSEDSLDADDCVSDEFTDFTLPLGYQGYGEGTGVVWYYASGYGTWYPFWSASWEESTGELALYGGYYEESLPYTSAPYYYTSWWTGYAMVSW